MQGLSVFQQRYSISEEDLLGFRFSVLHLHINVYQVCMTLDVNMELHSRNRAKIILWIAVVFVLGALITSILESTLSLVQTSRTVTTGGSVKGIGVGVYWDSGCTNSVSSINWGLLDPGSDKTVTVYVRNEGNSVTTLSKATQNWDPSTASSYMTLNWNYAGQTLNVNQVLQTKLTLIVSSAISGITSFSFDITITATG